MKIGYAKTVKNIQGSDGPIGQEAEEYVDVWVHRNYGVHSTYIPLRFTHREFGKIQERAYKQLQEIEPLESNFIEPKDWFVAGVCLVFGVLVGCLF